MNDTQLLNALEGVANRGYSLRITPGREKVLKKLEVQSTFIVNIWEGTSVQGENMITKEGTDLRETLGEALSEFPEST